MDREFSLHQVFSIFQQTRFFQNIYKPTPKPTSSCSDQVSLIKDYVLIVKLLFWPKTLVERVGIGKGKQDLIGLSIDFVKSTQVVPIRPEIPVCKKCTMHTALEIIFTLSGDIK